MHKQYNCAGRAGCVQLRQVLQTGQMVGVYHANQAGFDDDLPWATLCETHATIVNHSTLTLARYFASRPLEWCELCRASHEATIGGTNSQR